MADVTADAMVARLEGELEERNAFIQGTIAAAQDADRDLTDNETELIRSAKGRVDNIQSQLDTLYDSRESTQKARERSRQVHRELQRMRDEVDNGPVEYRSAGAYVLDQWKAHTGDREAAQRMEVYARAADHQKTGDNPGIIPDPVVGNVLDFIDASRPIVGALGPMNMPSSVWYRPKVTQRTAVGPQGTAGAAADEKTELVSQKLLITRLKAEAVTYGGYVNVSRQNIDFSSPQALDQVINSLSGQYSIETEAVTGAAIRGVATTHVPVASTNTQDDVAAAVWEAAGVAWASTQGQGRLILAVSPSVLGVFGPAFAPYGPQNQQGTGFSAANFGQGAVGTIAGIPVYASASLGTGEAALLSTAAIEVYEQRVGALQVVEPSVLGVQVAYAGYFTPLVVEEGGIVPIDVTIP